MKNYFRLVASVVIILVCVQSIAMAQTAPTISYQGVLQNNGQPMSGNQTLKILIYTVDSGGSPVYSETQSVNLANGIFNVAIGSVTPLLPTLDFKKQYYLAVSVNGGAELSPRSLVSFAPYAFRALNADTASFASTSARATLANGISGGYVSSVDGLYGTLTLTGTNGITVANGPGAITIGNTGVQSVNTAGGKVTLVGAGGTTVSDTGTVITIRSATFTGGTGIQAVQNPDSSITISNGSGPIATITLARQNATSGQALVWNGSAWRPATISGSGSVDSIKDLLDCRDDGSSVYLGAGSGTSNSGQNSNAALGIGALHSNTAGSGNTAIGYQTMSQNTQGVLNTAVGYQALQSGSNSNNSAFGYLALWNNSGSSNSAFGWEAMDENGLGSDNSAFGKWALIQNGTGNWNTAIGEDAMGISDSGSYNVAVGTDALRGGVSGTERSHTVAIGDSTLFYNGFSRSQHVHATMDSATMNTAVGAEALLTNSTGAYNTATGYHGLYANDIGYRNTAIGYSALSQNVNGNDNTALGSNAGPVTINLNNTTTLGSGAIASTSNSMVLGNSTVTSLFCQGAYAATTASSANVVVTSSGQIMRSTSSARYKTNIHDLDINTDRLYDLRPVSYISKIDGNSYFGLVAEDVAKVLPELAEYARAKDVIPGSKSDELIPDAVKYPMLSVLLLEELKKEHAKLERQERINADMEQRLEALEATQKAR